MPAPHSLSVIGLDTEGARFASEAYADAALAAWDSNRPGNGQLPLRNPGGARVATPSAREVQGWSVGKSPAAAKDQVTNNLVSRTGDAIVAAKAEAGLTVFAHDDPQTMRKAAGDLAARFRSHDHSLVSVFPWTGDGASHQRSCPMTDFHRSGEQGVLSCIVHYDRLGSPFTLAQGPQAFDRFLQWLFEAVCLGHSIFPDNPTAREVFESLGQINPCVSVSCYSSHVSMSRPVLGGTRFRKALGGRYTPAYADPVDVIAQAQHATRAALRDPGALAINEPIDLSLPFYLACSFPLRQSKEFDDLWERYQVWLWSEFPTAHPIAAVGGGLPLLNAQGERFVNVGVVYPLPRTVVQGGARNVKR
jgi:hypothetical protein